MVKNNFIDIRDKIHPDFSIWSLVNGQEETNIETMKEKPLTKGIKIGSGQC